MLTPRPLPNQREDQSAPLQDLANTLRDVFNKTVVNDDTLALEITPDIANYDTSELLSASLRELALLQQSNDRPGIVSIDLAERQRLSEAISSALKRLGVDKVASLYLATGTSLSQDDLRLDPKIYLPLIHSISAMLMSRFVSGLSRTRVTDPDFGSLLESASNILERANGAIPTALTAIETVGIAADLLLETSWKSAMRARGLDDSAELAMPRYLDGSIDGTADDEMNPRLATENIANTGQVTSISSRFQSCVSELALRGISGDVVNEREQFFFETLDSLTKIDKFLIDLQGSLASVSSLANGSAALYQEDAIPNARLLEEVLEMIALRTPQDHRAQTSQQSISVPQLIEGIKHDMKFMEHLSLQWASGGSLVGGLRNGLNHQVPRGIQMVILPIHAISSATNGAHPEVSHFPEIENLINGLIHEPGVLFSNPWHEGVGISTSGGTVSNNLSADLAFASAGAGLALKRACQKTDVSVAVARTGSGLRFLNELSDDEALMLHPDSFSKSLWSLNERTLIRLRDEFRSELPKVNQKYPPLVVIPHGEWVHYTLERHLVQQSQQKVERVLMNHEAEIDFRALRQIINNKLSSGPRPVILPITFCNTGCGRSGFSATELDDFVDWFTDRYGSAPLTIVDAAQGGLTFGMSSKYLSQDVLAAREAVGRHAMTMTLDPHKATLPLPCSLWVVRDPAWALFATSHSVSHSYLKTSNATELREAYQLSTPLESSIFAYKFLWDIKEGMHQKVFGPIFESSASAYSTFQSEHVTVEVKGNRYRLVAPLEPQSGILNACFVPVDSSVTMRQANEAASLVLGLLAEDRTSPISCSTYKLDLTMFNDPQKFKDRLGVIPHQWGNENTLVCLRFVFGQAGQDEVVTSDLPKLITSRFAV